MVSQGKEACSTGWETKEGARLTALENDAGSAASAGGLSGWLEEAARWAVCRLALEGAEGV